MFKKIFEGFEEFLESSRWAFSNVLFWKARQAPRVKTYFNIIPNMFRDNYYYLNNCFYVIYN